MEKNHKPARENLLAGDWLKILHVGTEKFGLRGILMFTDRSSWFSPMFLLATICDFGDKWAVGKTNQKNLWQLDEKSQKKKIPGKNR